MTTFEWIYLASTFTTSIYFLSRLYSKEGMPAPANIPPKAFDVALGCVLVFISITPFINTLAAIKSVKVFLFGNGKKKKSKV